MVSYGNISTEIWKSDVFEIISFLSIWYSSWKWRDEALKEGKTNQVMKTWMNERKEEKKKNKLTNFEANEWIQKKKRKRKEGVNGQKILKWINKSIKCSLFHSTKECKQIILSWLFDVVCTSPAVSYIKLNYFTQFNCLSECNDVNDYWSTISTSTFKAINY